MASIVAMVEPVTASLFGVVVLNENLPCGVALTGWGNELYGAMGLDLGEENPVEKEPEGAIADTNRGNLVCVFFGEKPAWPVEYIGQIKEGQWQKLLEKLEI